LLNQGSSRPALRDAEIDEGDSRRQIKNKHALSNIIRGCPFYLPDCVIQAAFFLGQAKKNKA
jgi:hypothetical protein